jgi:hypothetical protein
MLRKFWQKNSSNLQDYSDIFERTLKAFSASESKLGNTSLTPRAYLDPTITGWKKHSVARLVGNLGKDFNCNGPFTEILINSALTSLTDDTCFPFHVSILVNRDSAEERWKTLRSLKNLDAEIAYPVFYSSKLKNPQSFTEMYRKENKKEPGPNSSRLLHALDTLSQTPMKGQKTGNCWMKQNQRSVLASLYVEIVTHRPELTDSQAWNLSKKLYRKWVDFANQELDSMMDKGGISSDLIRIAREQIHGTGHSPKKDA